MALCTSNHSFIGMLVLAVLLLRLDEVASARLQPITGVLEAQRPTHKRKLLSCMAVNDPVYQPDPESTASLPFCITQNANIGDSWTAVGPDVQNSMLKANSADLAYAWYQDPDNPRTDSTLQCSGEVSTVKTDCWGGDKVHTDATFSMISCCTTQQVCYIKTGGCVL